MPLVVAGDGPELEHARAIAPDGVRFLGAVEAAQVVNLLQRARALVVPSLWYEPFGRVIIEAFAAGVPVIAGNIGGISEVVDEDRSGLLIPPRIEAAWLDALARLASDRESKRLGQGAYESWRENFSPEVALRSLEQIYREAIEHAQSKRGECNEDT
jgi:glycosyltransferase involved in cell wall biosynthesis